MKYWTIVWERLTNYEKGPKSTPWSICYYMEIVLLFLRTRNMWHLQSSGRQNIFLCQNNERTHYGGWEVTHSISLRETLRPGIHYGFPLFLRRAFWTLRKSSDLKARQTLHSWTTETSGSHNAMCDLLTSPRKVHKFHLWLNLHHISWDYTATNWSLSAITTTVGRGVNLTDLSRCRCMTIDINPTFETVPLLPNPLLNENIHDSGKTQYFAI